MDGSRDLSALNDSQLKQTLDRWYITYEDLQQLADIALANRVDYLLRLMSEEYFQRNFFLSEIPGALLKRDHLLIIAAMDDDNLHRAITLLCKHCQSGGECYCSIRSDPDFW